MRPNDWKWASKWLLLSNVIYIRYQLFSGWWFQPIWKILVKLDHFPNFRDENKKYFKTTTQFCSQKGQVTEQILAQGPEAMIQDHIPCPAPKVKTGEKPLKLTWGQLEKSPAFLVNTIKIRVGFPAGYVSLVEVYLPNSFWGSTPPKPRRLTYRTWKWWCSFSQVPPVFSGSGRWSSGVYALACVSKLAHQIHWHRGMVRSQCLQGMVIALYYGI